MKKEIREKYKSGLKLGVMVIIILMAIPTLYVFILLQSNGKYTLFGPRPKVDIRLSKIKNYDFRIMHGVQLTNSIVFYSITNDDELLWEIKFKHNENRKAVKYLKYGVLPKEGLEQVFPNNININSALSIPKDVNVQKVSTLATLPRKPSDLEIIRAVISSYCGHNYEQPNCREERDFIFSNGRFNQTE